MTVDRTVRITLPTLDNSVEIAPEDNLSIFNMLYEAASEESKPVAFFSNGELVDARIPFVCDSEVRPVRMNTLYGQHVYRRSIIMLFAAAAAKALPTDHFSLRHTVGYAWYFHCGRVLSTEEVDKINATMAEFVEAKAPFEVVWTAYDAARKIFQERGDEVTLSLLNFKTDANIPLVRVNGFTDACVGPVVPHAGVINAYNCLPYKKGVAVQYPHHLTPLEIPEFTDNPVLTKTHAEHNLWSRRLGIDTVGGLNEYIRQGRERELVQLCDINQERYIANVANSVPEACRLLLIAGPSSSGKTTFARKLCVHLRCRGLEPVYMGCDDFYVNRVETPRHPDGSYDFEAVEAIDLPFLNNHLEGLLAGKDMPVPHFNFMIGEREFRGETQHLPSNGILVLEGIHCLNDRLTQQIPAEQKYKVFISPLNAMQVTDRARLSTSDNRMIRRMVRDFKTRGHSASATLGMWESVRSGEDKHIYRFQNTADVVMNSALNYELAVLSKQAKPLLQSIPPTDPGYADARRVLHTLNQFLPIDEKHVPNVSILQEFVGVQYLFA